MARRHPQPFWRELMQCWYVQIGKKQTGSIPNGTRRLSCITS